MIGYTAPLRDLRFVLHELLDVCATSPADGGEALDRETIDQILDAAGTFAAEVIAPLNGSGDREGCRMPAPGVVQTPAGFRAAYERFCAGGWTALACDPVHGGQGMPSVLDNALYEMFCGANMGWAAYPGMSHAAYTCLATNGDPAQQALYLPRIASGEWAGTMCLTEPHAGTDLGLLRTRAQPRADGSYAVTGTKIFISGGEQDLTDNIVHLVLARMPDAPPGVKGISLFIVPKFLPTAEGGIGERNALACGSIEHKMGIHGNATCTMNFDGATGWLLGEANRGLAAMFVMMNHARIVVGVNAIGLMDAAYQKALAYARDRTQGRAPTMAARSGPADPILAHADVRRMLLTQKAYVEGARAFALWASQLADVQHRGADPKERERAAKLLALATPIVKAFSSELAVECTSMAMQVFGGHGFITDNGVEQHLRDARIIPLYEGANGIQAMDLLGRKVLADGGAGLGAFLDAVEQFAQAQDDGLREFAEPLSEVVALARRAARDQIERASADPDAAGAAAMPFLRLIGHVALAWMWARMAAVARARQSPDGDPIYRAKLATARFYFERLLPETQSLAVVLAADPSDWTAGELDWL
ncbi:acyl-CoA dehydrogenase C-terminal domain-containing protein [Variovorax sp. J31P207]|uniref:acyl-CoA dehydrogenase C-terminal domain-containing protein n=1 Tax=Variovorax sp. J31P207 TaxID=3053510 RepID=UPI002578E8FE|nr:acyl-CoA dehydrogenase C-terminal domain-containing protein [Variovorax sp. J31P207]MDM0069553.1 acyl-CoA dehydrogenase C-terminal domain-containing protein [Variovorax sp. J31P207]